jgi:hypothetical protein
MITSRNKLSRHTVTIQAINIFEILPQTNAKHLGLFFLLSFALEFSCSSQSCAVPFHAVKLNSSDCAWECKKGYYTTTPSSIGGVPTCRPCSRQHTCGVGKFQMQCTSISDSTCTSCQYLQSIPGREGEVYNLPNDCTSTLCGDGWWLNDNFTLSSSSSSSLLKNKCLPCPPGAYCKGGALYHCGANCSTGTAGGVSSLLECKQTVGQELAFSVRFTISGTGLSPTNSQCKELNLGILGWLQYGTFQGCFIDILTPTLGTATCTVTAAHCVAGDYISWLFSQLKMRQVQTTFWLSSCLQSPNLFVGAPIMQQQSTASQSSYSVKASKPTDPPSLIIETQKWGVSHAEALAAFGLFTLLCLGLVIALMLLCAMWQTSVARQKIVGKLYDKLQNRRKSSKIEQKIQALKGAVLKKDVP